MIQRNGQVFIINRMRTLRGGGWNDSDWYPMREWGIGHGQMELERVNAGL
jgi:hypothetical protein